MRNLYDKPITNATIFKFIEEFGSNAIMGIGWLVSSLKSYSGIFSEHFPVLYIIGKKPSDRHRFIDMITDFFPKYAQFDEANVQYFKFDKSTSREIASKKNISKKHYVLISSSKPNANSMEKVFWSQEAKIIITCDQLPNIYHLKACFLIDLDKLPNCNIPIATFDNDPIEIFKSMSQENLIELLTNKILMNMRRRTNQTKPFDNYDIYDYLSTHNAIIKSGYEIMYSLSEQMPKVEDDFWQNNLESQWSNFEDKNFMRYKVQRQEKILSTIHEERAPLTTFLGNIATWSIVILVVIVILNVTVGLINIIGNSKPNWVIFDAWLYGTLIPFVWFARARLHDVGFNWLFLFVPILNIYLLVARGQNYRNCYGLPQNFEIFTEYDNSQYRDNPLAAYYRGIADYFGDDTELNEERAFENFKTAALIGFEPALYCLGMCYLKGIGVKQDVKKAIVFISKAAKKGYPFACYNMGLLSLVAHSSYPGLRNVNKSKMNMIKAMCYGHPNAASSFTYYFGKHDKQRWKGNEITIEDAVNNCEQIQNDIDLFRKFLHSNYIRTAYKL